MSDKENEILLEDNEIFYHNGIGMEFRSKKIKSKKQIIKNKNLDKKEKSNYENIKNKLDKKFRIFYKKRKKD